MLCKRERETARFSRESNIELFRIVATFLILIVHCNGWFLREWGDITTWSAGRGLIVGTARAYIQSLSCIGVNCFVLISGFFSLKPKLKSLVNIFTILVFFYVGTYLLTCYIGQETLSWWGLKQNLCAFSRNNWFIQCYLFLMLLSPMLNAFVEKVNSKQLLIYTLIYIGCMFYFSCVKKSEYFYFNHGYSVTHFVAMYLVGRYLSKYGIEQLKEIKTYWFWIAFLAVTTIMVCVRFLSSNEGRWLSYESPLLILSSAILLLAFTRMKIQSRTINFIAKSTLSVYIFHTCSPIIGWFANTDVRLFNELPFGLYLLEMFGVIVGVFVTAILLDKIRILLFTPLYKFVERIKLPTFTCRNNH